MKLTLLIASAILSLPLQAYEIKVHVIDEVGVPVVGAMTSIFLSIPARMTSTTV